MEFKTQVKTCRVYYREDNCLLLRLLKYPPQNPLLELAEIKKLFIKQFLNQFRILLLQHCTKTLRNDIDNKVVQTSFKHVILINLNLSIFRKLHCPRNILHMNLFASFIFRAFFFILKDILFVKGTGLWGDFSMKNGELYFKTDFEVSIPQILPEDSVKNFD